MYSPQLLMWVERWAREWREGKRVRGRDTETHNQHYKIKRRQRPKRSLLRPRSELRGTHPCTYCTDITLWMHTRGWCVYGWLAMTGTINVYNVTVLGKSIRSSSTWNKSLNQEKRFKCLLLSNELKWIWLWASKPIAFPTSVLLTSRLLITLLMKGQTQTNNFNGKPMKHKTVHLNQHLYVK